jgi:hypothetical protein
MQAQTRLTTPPAALDNSSTEQPTAVILIMVCGSRNDTVVTTSRWSRTVVDLTLQHTNHTVLVEGPEIMIRPVGTRRLVAGGAR